MIGSREESGRDGDDDVFERIRFLRALRRLLKTESELKPATVARKVRTGGVGTENLGGTCAIFFMAIGVCTWRGLVLYMVVR